MEQARLAGAALVSIVSINIEQRKKGIDQDLRDDLERCFAHSDHGHFRGFHKQAIRIAIKARHLAMITYLVQKDVPGSLLDEDPDMLQLPIRGRELDYSNVEEPTSVIQLLLHHGARVNGLDEHGNTPLFYACARGLPHIFRALIEHGADFTTIHKLPLRYHPDGDVPPFDELPRDLMQGTIYAIDHSLTIVNSMDRVFERWGGIVVFFLAKGYNGPQESHVFVELLWGACKAGDFQAVQVMLERDGTCSAVNLGPGLCSATVQGHAEIVKLLLRAGADPQIESQDPLELRRYDPYPPDKWNQPPAAKTPIAAACQRRNARVLDACELLYETGISEADQQILLAEAAFFDRIDLVKKVWAAGVRPREAPLTKSIRVIEFFETQGCRIDWSELQYSAARRCDIDLLKWSVERAGSCLRVYDVFGDWYWTLFSGGDQSRQKLDAVLRYLADGYGRSEHRDNVEATRWLFDGVMSQPSYLRLVLQGDKSLGSPQMRKAAWLVLKRAWQGPEPPMPREWIGDRQVKSYQWLVRYCEGTLGNNTTDEVDDLWLTPGMLASLFVGVESSMEAPSRLYTADRCLHHTRTNPSLLSSQVNSPIEPSVHDGGDARAFCGDGGIDPRAGHYVQGSTNPSDGAVDRDTEADYSLQNSGALMESEYVHQRLEGPRATRLLILEPSEDPTSMIECSLMNVNLSEEPTYEALSYVWGAPTHHACLRVDGKLLPVRQNLWAALSVLRRGLERRTLWVDAVCINQADVEEKNQHVRYMRYIYQSASQVLIWIGEPDDDAVLVFKALEHRNHKPSRRTFGRAQLEGNELQAYKTLCSRPWFSRTWVIQEYALSKRALVLCGQYSAEWSEFVQSETPGPHYNVLTGLNTIRHVHALGDMQENSLLDKVLEYSTVCQAIDPRDKVYGLLGLLNYPALRIDYNATVEEVYTSFTQAVLQDQKRIVLLHHFSRKVRATLPSWVPDYSASPQVSLLPRDTQPFTVQKDKDLTWKVQEGFRFDGNAMIIKGIPLDQVEEVACVLSAEQPDPPGTPGFTETMRKWETCACKIDRPSVPSEFLSALRANRDGPEYGIHYIDHMAVQWYEFFGSGVLKRRFPAYWQDADVMLQWNANSTQPLLAEGFLENIVTTCYGRRFFATKNGTLGLGNAGTRAGDLIVFFPGGAYPFAIRPDGDSFRMIGDCYLSGFDRRTVDGAQIQNCKEFVLR